MVQFLPANLTGEWPSLPRMDVVLVERDDFYFDVETKKRKISGAHPRAAAPGRRALPRRLRDHAQPRRPLERVLAAGATYYRDAATNPGLQKPW